VKSPWVRALARAALVAAFAVLPFLPGVRGPFIFDDLNTIIQNPAIRRINLDRFFTDPGAFSVKPGNWPYRPLTVAANAVVFRIANVDPLPWHLFQIVAHLINSLLVMAAARRVFGLKSGALIAGLLFAAAPLQTQAVLYVSAKSMTLALTPALVAVIAVVEAGRAGKERDVLLWRGLCVTCSALAFFTSEGALALVLFLPLALYASGQSWRGQAAIRTLAAVAAAAALYVLARSLLTPGAGLVPHARVAPPYTHLQHAALQLRFPFVMARLFLLPLHLSFLHDAPAPAGILDPLAWLPAAGTAAAAALIALFRKRRAPAAGAAWYLAALLPAVIVPLNIAWAEHRSYLALPGLAVAVGYVAQEILTARQKHGRSRVLPARLCLAAALVMLAALSWERSQQWSSPMSIFRDAVKNAPGHDVPWSFLANEERQRLRYRDALRSLDLAIALNPRFADAYSSRAVIFISLGMYEAAADSARRAVELDPGNGTYWNNLGTALMYLKLWKEAEAPMRRALELTPPEDPNRLSLEKNWRTLQEHPRTGAE